MRVSTVGRSGESDGEEPENASSSSRDVSVDGAGALLDHFIAAGKRGVMVWRTTGRLRREWTAMECGSLVEGRAP